MTTVLGQVLMAIVAMSFLAAAVKSFTTKRPAGRDTDPFRARSIRSSTGGPMDLDRTVRIGLAPLADLHDDGPLPYSATLVPTSVGIVLLPHRDAHVTVDGRLCHGATLLRRGDKLVSGGSEFAVG